MTFDEIIGQKEIIEKLKYAAVNDIAGHAYIFSGPDGIGKKTVAGIFAALLLCESPSFQSTCNECRACKLFSSGSNPDLRIIRAEGASIGVDEVREIHSDVIIKPMYSKRKVYIIENADKMTVQAQNSLLKTLEEPPSYIVIILTASNYEALLGTIRSRAQRLDFRRNTKEQVHQAIVKKFSRNIEGIEFAAGFANGIIGKALELVSDNDFKSMRDKIFKLLSEIPQTGLFDLLETFNIFDENKEDIGLVLDFMLLYYRDLLVYKETGNEKLLINYDKKDIILNNVTEYTFQKLTVNMEQIEAARRMIKQNANFQLVIENMLMKLQEE